jgi:alpha-beta hydrolase superfamily lysophospholipase
MSREPAVGRFDSLGGVRLNEYWWPLDDAKAAVFLIHGYGEHAGRYQHIADALATHGYALYAFDLRGHGKSEGERAFINTFDSYVADVDAALKRFDYLREGVARVSHGPQHGRVDFDALHHVAEAGDERARL